jgi:hypothetical protein
MAPSQALLVEEQELPLLKQPIRMETLVKPVVGGVKLQPPVELVPAALPPMINEPFT